MKGSPDTCSKASLGILGAKVETRGDTLKADTIINCKAGHNKWKLTLQEIRNKLWFEQKFGTKAEYWIPHRTQILTQCTFTKKWLEKVRPLLFCLSCFLKRTKRKICLLFNGIIRTQESSLCKIPLHFPDSVTLISSGNKLARHYKNQADTFPCPLPGSHQLLDSVTEQWNPSGISSSRSQQ